MMVNLLEGLLDELLGIDLGEKRELKIEIKQILEKVEQKLSTSARRYRFDDKIIRQMELWGERYEKTRKNYLSAVRRLAEKLLEMLQLLKRKDYIVILEQNRFRIRIFDPTFEIMNILKEVHRSVFITGF